MKRVAEIFSAIFFRLAPFERGSNPHDGDDIVQPSISRVYYNRV